MLAGLAVDWLDLEQAGIMLEVEESGASLTENATLKAKGYAAASGLLTLADDTGLEVDALGGEPGIYPARFGGAGLTPAERVRHLLSRLNGVPATRRTARFRCVIALARPGELIVTVEGVCEGRIAEAPAGDHGFGYDPVFFLPAQGRTMAQLLPAEKHRLSHRGQAIRALAPILRQML